MNLLSRHGAFIAFVVGYAAILAFQLDHGLASGDGHGIVRSVQTLLDNGRWEVSRPPGHPTTEWYLFGAVGWILQKGFGIEFGDKVYLICQPIGTLTASIVFYELFLSFPATRVRALLGVVCLAFSPPFF